MSSFADGMSSPLRALADRTIGPIDRAYLRPWMCEGDPEAARVFLVGANPATPFPSDSVERARYLEALVRGGQPLRDLYMAARGGTESPTRRNIGRVVAVLREAGVEPVLETNVWSKPTPSLAALRESDAELVRASSRVVIDLIDLVRPTVVIVHGATATRALARLLGRDIELADRAHPVRCTSGSPVIFSLPSLSPPPANAWMPSAADDLRSMAVEVRRLIDVR